MATIEDTNFNELQQDIANYAAEQQSSRAAARNARNTSGKTSYDEILDKINSWGDKTSGAVATLGGIAATIGNVAGNFKNGYNTANARPINDIKVESDSLKTFGVLLVILAVIFVFKKNK